MNISIIYPPSSRQIFIRFLLVLSLILYTLSLLGQSNYKSGYIITQQGDTIHGLVNELRKNKKYSICKFKEGESSDQKTYFPEEILGYGFKDGRAYVSESLNLHTGDSGVYFVEVIIRGTISLYNIYDSYLLKSGDNPLVELYKESKKIYKEGSDFIESKKPYLDQLKTSLSECPYVSAQINADLDLTQKDLVALIKDYNSCKGYPEFTYITPKPHSRLEWEIRVGGHFTSIIAPYSHRLNADVSTVTIDQVQYSDTIINYALWSERGRFKTSVKPSLGIRGKLSFNSTHSVFFQFGLSYSTSSLEKTGPAPGSLYTDNEVLFEYSMITVPLGVGKRFYFNNSQIDFSGGFSAHFSSNIRSRGNHIAMDPSHILPDNLEHLIFEEYLQKSDVRIGLWAELLFSPFETPLGKDSSGSHGKCKPSSDSCRPYYFWGRGI